jgi:toxin ParE1/3/4
MKQVVFHPLAEKEFIDAAVYYEEQESGLGGEYLAEVEHAINFIA